MWMLDETDYRLLAALAAVARAGWSRDAAYLAARLGLDVREALLRLEALVDLGVAAPAPRRPRRGRRYVITERGLRFVQGPAPALQPPRNPATTVLRLLDR